MKLIKREHYMQKLIEAKGTPDIKVITGVRRCGKSKLLDSFIDYIQSVDENANVIHINLQDLEFEELLEYHALHEYVMKHYEANLNNYVCIDEVQMCFQFEKAVNSLHAKELFDIYITGSNAFLLSSDLATLFTGRTFAIEVYPFSFKEYLQYYELDDIDKAFESYIFEGGMPGSYVYKTMNAKYKYINNDVFQSLVVRDIFQKYKIKNKDVFYRLVDFLMDNISNLTSLRKIADTLTSNKVKINHKTIGNYVDYVTKAYLFYRIRRYDIKGRRYLASEDKYYACDHAFIYAKLGIKSLDFGRSMENIVAIELLRRGYEVYVGVLYQKEIDFVAMKQHEKMYIQVADNIADENTLQREVDPLLKIKDAYPKILIARTKHPEVQHEGIRIMDIARWLMEE